LGLGALTPTQGLAAVERLLNVPAPHLLMLPIDWRRYLDSPAGRTAGSFLSEIMGIRHDRGNLLATPKQHLNTTQQLRQLPPSRQSAAVADILKDKLVHALALDRTRTIDPHTPFGEIGLDSLLAVELRNALGTVFGRALPATLLFDYPTLDALTTYVLAELVHDAPPAPASAPAPPRAAIDAVEDLSEDELDRRLAARMRRADA
ncbi:MAG: acyl carrier protein, partial [Actinomycetospora chiangmaiensis]|nr:acyl carrier protein [Actinomycetospora chiangmaiensis]